MVSPRGGFFRGPADDALQSQGLQRNVVVSAANFLVLLDIVATSDIVALVPARLVRHHTARLALRPPPLQVVGVALSLVWHDRVHHHPAHRWVRDA